MSGMLSIIVPVYNVAPYLRSCLQSISEQRLENFEVLLVNDASRDNSMSICRDFCSEHAEFRLLNHERNLGLSEARNTGLRAATGEYVTFVDSDDLLAPDTLRMVMEDVGEADAAEYPFVVGYLTKNPKRWQPEAKTVTFDEWMRNGYEHTYAWNKVFRRRLWTDMCFPRGKFFEDMRTIPYVLSKAAGIRFVSRGTYYYCTRAGSISQQTDLPHLHDYAEAIAALYNWSDGNNLNLYLRALNAELSYERAGGERRFVKRRTIPWSFILRRGITWRQRMKAIWFKYRKRA